MAKDFNYEKDIEIDPDQLDVEWLQQPELMLKYTKMEGKAKRRVEHAKENLNIVEAELYQEICNNPERFDLPKTTESAIAGAIKLNDHYKEAKEALTQAEYELNMNSAAVRSLYGKKEALENLVHLFGQQYFAGPKAPGNLTKKWRERQKQKNSNKKVKIKRRSK